MWLCPLLAFRMHARKVKRTAEQCLSRCMELGSPTLADAAFPCCAGAFQGPAAQLRASLKHSVGKLLGQLFDRNSRRPFAPPAAFYADNLAPELFQQEVRSAAAVSGGLMEATHTRVWAILRYAFTSVRLQSKSGPFPTPP